MDRPINFDRIPPQSLDMEQAALGAMLIERAAIEKAAEILEWKDFYSPAHQVVFDAILALTTTDRPVDLYTVQEQLKLQGVLEKIGGASYLVQLMNAPPSAANVEYYAKIVEEKAILRRLLEASSSVQAQCYSEYEDINEVVDSAEKAIFGVTQRRMKSYFSDMKTLANEVYTQVEHRSDNRDMTIGLETPFSEFNYMTSGLQPSDLIIVAARPSMGKTSLVLNIGQHAAMNQKTVAVFSLEMSKEQLCMRMICSEARVGQTALRTGFVPTGDWPKVGNAVAKLSACPIYIDDSPDCSAQIGRAHV